MMMTVMSRHATTEGEGEFLSKEQLEETGGAAVGELVETELS